MSFTLQKFTFGILELFVRFFSPTSGVYSIGARMQVSCPRKVVHAVNGVCTVLYVTRVLYVFHKTNNVFIDYIDKPSSKYQCNLGRISPDVITCRWLRYLKLSQLRPTPPSLRLPSRSKEEWERCLERYNLTHILKRLICFYCMYGGLVMKILWPLELSFNEVNRTISSRRYFWEETWSRFVQMGLRAYVFLCQLQSKDLDSLCLNILDIVILIVRSDKRTFLKGNSGHRWVCAWCKHLGV